MTLQEAQREAALARANEIRFANARTLREIRSQSYVDGIDALIDVLRNADERGPVGGLPILRLLKAPRRLGECKAMVLLRAAGVVSGDRRFRDLTMRQRLRIADCLEDPELLWPSSSVPQLRRERDRVAEAAYGLPRVA